MPNIIKSYIKFIDYISLKTGRATMYLVFVMMFILILSFVTRNIINIPLIWIIEMAQFVMTGYYLLGGGYSLLSDDLGLSRPHMPYKGLIMAILISPMIVPLIITAAGMFFFYARINLVYTFTGVILAHVALATPFVVITVTATLVGFDMNMVKASQSLGAMVQVL